MSLVLGGPGLRRVSPARPRARRRRAPPDERATCRVSVTTMRYNLQANVIVPARGIDPRRERWR